MKLPYNTPSYSNIGGPTLDIVVSNPVQSSSVELKGLIDTGYDGEIIVPFALFEKLNLFAFELGKDYFSIAETASGEQLSLTSAYGLLRIDVLELDVEVIIDTHNKCEETIIGRKFLEEFDLCLYGKQQAFEINISDSRKSED